MAPIPVAAMIHGGTGEGAGGEGGGGGAGGKEAGGQAGQAGHAGHGGHWVNSAMIKKIFQKKKECRTDVERRRKREGARTERRNINDRGGPRSELSRTGS